MTPWCCFWCRFCMLLIYMFEQVGTAHCRMVAEFTFVLQTNETWHTLNSVSSLWAASLCHLRLNFWSVLQSHWSHLNSTSNWISYEQKTLTTLKVFWLTIVYLLLYILVDHVWIKCVLPSIFQNFLHCIGVSGSGSVCVCVVGRGGQKLSHFGGAI